jgi:hypothetical protein
MPKKIINSNYDGVINPPETVYVPPTKVVLYNSEDKPMIRPVGFVGNGNKVK